jgi:hypothetical protein
VNHHAGWLVDDDEVIVLEDDVEWYLLSNCIEWKGGGNSILI